MFSLLSDEAQSPLGSSGSSRGDSFPSYLLVEALLNAQVGLAGEELSGSHLVFLTVLCALLCFLWNKALLLRSLSSFFFFFSLESCLLFLPECFSVWCLLYNYVLALVIGSQ